MLDSEDMEYSNFAEHSTELYYSWGLAELISGRTGWHSEPGVVDVLPYFLLPPLVSATGSLDGSPSLPCLLPHYRATFSLIYLQGWTCSSGGLLPGQPGLVVWDVLTPLAATSSAWRRKNLLKRQLEAETETQGL